MGSVSVPPVRMPETRAAHWIRLNHQCRIPIRFIVFDTESQSRHSGLTETQTWRLGAGIRWRTDLKSGIREESSVFTTPQQLWQWVSDYCRKGQRTVIWAHNLAYDVRISDALEILPQH